MPFVAQKTLYALKAVFELAKYHGRGPLKVSRIAESQEIPHRFLENILIQLKQGGIVSSRRGKEGGYLLAAAPCEVTVAEVIGLLESSLAGPAANGNGDPAAVGCVFEPLWTEARAAVMEVYERVTFADLIDQEQMAQSPLSYTI